MKLTTGILILGLAGAAWAQNPDVIQDTRSTLQNTQKKQTIDQNAVLAAAGQGQSSPASSPPAAAPANPAASSSAGSNRPSAAAKSSPAASKAAKVAAKKSAGQPEATPAPVAETKPAGEKPEKTPAVAVEDKTNPAEPKKEERTFSAAGKRDPFLSPVVTRSLGGSGCSTGRRCLAIDQIELTGVVKSESGMIAVVVNAMNKAYFLRENDPVFDGYVVKITGDSIVFKETIEDKLGKPLTREVTKRIVAPAV